MTNKLTRDQINQLVNDPAIQATVEANKIKAAKARDTELMMLGYNQALLDVGQAALPEGWTIQDLQEVVNRQREKLGV
jgi:hypothetical protein